MTIIIKTRVETILRISVKRILRCTTIHSFVVVVLRKTKNIRLQYKSITKVMDVPSRMQYSSASCTTHDHTERFSLGYFLSKISCITMRYCRMSKKDVKGLIRRMYESYLSEKEKVLGLQQYYRRGLQQ